MSPRLPVVSGREMIQRTRPRRLRRDDGRTVIVPLHRELAPGTARSILRQASLSVEEFETLG